MEHQDSLAHGVVVERVEGGDWWHGHIVRSDLEYHSKLLRRQTNLLFLIGKFGRGGTRKSTDFYLTLDAEGVPQQLLPIRYNGDWGKRSNDSDLRMEGLHIQDNVLPLLRNSEQFQTALATVVRHQEYATLANVGDFVRIGGNF